MLMYYIKVFYCRTGYLDWGKNIGRLAARMPWLRGRSQTTLTRLGLVVIEKDGQCTPNILQIVPSPFFASIFSKMNI